MTDTSTLVDTHLAAFDEHDDDRRRALVEEVFAEDASYVDPVMSAAGTGLDVASLAPDGRMRTDIGFLRPAVT